MITFYLPLTQSVVCWVLSLRYNCIYIGAVAQLGERYNGIVEVWGSIPHGSTISLSRGYGDYRGVLRGPLSRVLGQFRGVRSGRIGTLLVLLCVMVGRAVLLSGTVFCFSISGFHLAQSFFLGASTPNRSGCITI